MDQLPGNNLKNLAIGYKLPTKKSREKIWNRYNFIYTNTYR